MDKEFDLGKFEHIYLLGFGKGSAEVCRILEEKLGDKLTNGWDIDVVDEAPFKKLHYTKGTHPLPSQVNIDFTSNVLEQLKNLTEKDLVLVVICGGGSAMFESPAHLSFERLQKLFSDMLKSGADITEMNVVRKHVSSVKGGGLAHFLYPATVASLIFSDVPGNDLSTIASGPTVKDSHTLDDTKAILAKYNLQNDVEEKDFSVTPTEDKYFEKVSNIIVLSNMTALTAMQEKAQENGLNARIFSDKVQGDAHEVGKKLIDETKPGEILLAAGESTVKVTGNGKGGRNQTLVLSCLEYLNSDTLIVSFDSDGWDFYKFAGAIADKKTVEKAKELNLNPETFLQNDDSTAFFEKTGDGIDTGRLESNVSDLYIIYKF